MLISNSFRKKIAVSLLLVFVFEIFHPLSVFALSGGPSQPEIESFKAVDISNMVDPFTGDFSYNIPLFDIGGYPINLAYDGNVSPEAEASWVGAGWNLNPGCINREIRGIPDDFNGEPIVREFNIRDNYTITLGINKNLEIFGKDMGGLNLSGAFLYNNYSGFGIEFGATISKSLNKSNDDKYGFKPSLGITSGPNGVGVSGDLSFKANGTYEKAVSAKGGFNSRSGFYGISIEASLKKNKFLTQIKYDENTQQIIETKSTKPYKEGGSILTSNISFNNSPNVSPNNYPLYSSSISGHISFGNEINGFNTNMAYRASFSMQKLKDKILSTKTYGLLNINNAEEEDLLDYAKESDIPFTRYTVRLGMPYFTSDIFNVMSHDVSGQFKVKRSDNGVLSINKSSNESNGGSIGLQFGAGAYAKFGYNANFTNSSSENQKWIKSNDLSSAGNNQFIGEKDNNPRFYGAYIHNATELSVFSNNVNDGLINKFAIENRLLEPFNVKNNADGSAMQIQNKYKYENSLSENIGSPENYQSDQRQGNSIVMSYLTVNKAKSHAIDKKIKNYPILNVNTNGYFDVGKPLLSNALDFNEYDRSSFDSPDNHISEISITKDNGMRYIYGLPLHNFTKEEYTFNTENEAYDSNLNSARTLIKYNINERTSSNNVGKDHFYEKKITPNYVYAYYLTSVLSPDFIDLSDNGPTEDDLGNYVNFNYSKIHHDFKWRTPASALINMATFSPGFNCVSGDNSEQDGYVDNKANITYGTKEIWYCQSIESKDQIAFFLTSDRSDGIEVVGVDGGYNSNSRKLKKLDKIVVYSKAQVKSNAGSLLNTAPIKTILFEYYQSTQSLFPGIPNSNISGGGKLTLKSVKITYGTNKKGELNPYIFEYYTSFSLGGQNTIFNYADNRSDRWGNYKHQNSNGIPNHVYSYTEQNKSIQDEYSKAGMLRKITLPSKSKITVDYESDDYAYVQQNKAAVMKKIRGFGETVSDQRLYGNNDLGKLHGTNYNSLYPKANNYLSFDIDNSINTREELFDTYLKDIIDKKLYFNVAVKMTKENIYDRIKGYARIDDYGVIVYQDQKIGWILLKDIDEESSNDKYNPMAFSALQTIRTSIPEIAYPNAYIDPNESFKNIMIAFGNQFISIAEMFTNFNKKKLREGYCTDVDLKQSWIKLMDDDGFKLGGGNRVKKVSIDDNWTAMTGQPSTTYSINYEYTIEDPSTNQLISSGVAQYEPMLGIEEYLGKSAVSMVEKVSLAQDNFSYAETPIGEELYPSAIVGYSKVTIKTLGSDGSNSSGYSIKEFYTAKDFPVYTKSTNLDVIARNNPLRALFNIRRNDYYSASQGHLVVVNDMHGKSKMESSFDASNSLVLKKITKYHQMLGAKVPMVGNVVKVVDEMGNINEEILGLDADIYQEMNENTNSTLSAGFDYNLDIISAFPPVPVPIPVPTVWPAFSFVKKKTRTSIVTRFVRKAGIIKEVETIDANGAINRVENLVFDKKTGACLITKTNTAYSKKSLNQNFTSIYNTTIPAYWKYDGLAPAYLNQGMKIKLQMANGYINNPNIFEYLKAGDEVFISQIIASNEIFNSKKYHVIEVTLGNEKRLRLINRDGYFFYNGNNLNAYVHRTAARNSQSSPMMTITSNDSPILDINQPNQEYAAKLNIENLTKVLNASAVEYHDYKSIYCKSNPQTNCYRENVNPYASEVGFLLDLLLYYFSNTLWNANILNAQQLLSYYINGNPNELISQNKIDYIASLNDFSVSWPIGINNSFAISFRLGNCVLDITIYRVRIRPTIESNWLSLGPLQVVSNIRNDKPWNASKPYTYQTIDLENNDGSPGNIIVFPIERMSMPPTEPEDNPTTIGAATFTCETCTTACVEANEDDFINPYAKGLKGNWRPYRSYTYLDKRVRGTYTDIYKDGIFENWNPFWYIDQQVWKNVLNFSSNNPDYHTNWKWDTQITITDSKGNELEQKDPLNRFSSALYSYNRLLNTAVATNAKLNQIANDHFEDYGFAVSDVEPCFQNHWDFRPTAQEIDISNDEAHTGIKSLTIPVNSSFKVTRVIEDYEYKNGIDRGEHQNYILKKGNCIKQFSPDSSKYILSAWVKKNGLCSPSGHYDALINVKLKDVSDQQTQSFDLTPSGPIIDGWQRVEGRFFVTENDKSIDVEAFNNDNSLIFLDDIRIHPLNATMKTFVYNPYNLRLMATLDENNYATFYEYDSEGKLIRMKRETDKGIVTVKENRQELRKIN